MILSMYLEFLLDGGSSLFQSLNDFSNRFSFVCDPTVPSAQICLLVLSYIIQCKLAFVWSQIGFKYPLSIIRSILSMEVMSLDNMRP